MNMNSARIKVCFLAVAALGVWYIVYCFLSRPSYPATRLGLRGLKRQCALIDNTSWASVEPIIRWLGVRLHGMVSARFRGGLDRDITLAGDFLGLTAEEYFATRLLSGGLVAALAAGVALICDVVVLPCAAVGALFGSYVPRHIVDGRRGERLYSIEGDLPYAIDLLALALGAGSDLPAAIQHFVEKSKSSKYLREEFSLILHQLRIGRSRVSALQYFLDRAPVSSVREFVTALILAEERGNPVVLTMQTQATIARSRRSAEAEARANQMKAKLVLPNIIISMLPAMFIMSVVAWVMTQSKVM